MIKRLLKTIVIFIAFIALSLTGLNYLGIALDEKPLEYTGLIPLTEVAPKDNGFIVLEKMLWARNRELNNKLTQLLEENWDNETVTQFVELHQDKFNIIDVVLSKPAFQSNSNDFQAESSSYLRYTELIDLTILKSRHLANQNNFTQAITLIESGINFSQMIKHDESATLISYLVGAKLEHRILNWLHRLISNYPVSQDNLSQLARILREIPSYQNDHFNLIATGEFIYLQSIPNNIASPNLQTRFNLFFNNEFYWMSHNMRGNPNILLELLAIPSHHYFYQQVKMTNDTYKNLLAIQKKSNIDFCNEIFFQKNSFTTNSLWNKLGLNALGNNQYSQSVWQTTLERRCFNNFYQQAIKTIIATKRYALTNNGKATSLEQLIPDFLESMPIDAFNGEPLLFNHKAQTIYSTGMNFLDNGGQNTNYSHQCFDVEACKKNPTIAIEINISNLMEAQN